MVRFTLNGKPIETQLSGLTRLIDVLRDDAGDTSVKEGCGEGECGACSILLNGKLVNSCIIPVAQVDGKNVMTMEGFSSTPRGKVLIEAFASEGAVQCGFCIPGMVLAGEAILALNPKPTDDDIRIGLSGNLCRCTGYDLIVRAIATAADNGAGLW